MFKRILTLLVCLTLLLAGGCGLPRPRATAPQETTAATSAAATPGEEGPPATETAAPETPAPTDAPTEAPTAPPAPTASVNPADGMIFPDSDTRLLTWEELIGLDAETLDLARNEIFARAGYAFTKQKYKDYYGKCSWYKPDAAFSEKNFSETQLVNIKLIQVAEGAVKGGLTPIPSGTTLDYDQDGKLETLTFNAPDDYHMNVRLAEGDAVTTWAIECENPSKKVYLGDVDHGDGLLDLFVDEYGPSDDYFIYVAAIKSGGFMQRDSVPGAISQMKVNGKGTVSTMRRMSILMTWFARVSYRLNKAGKLVFVEQDSYSMDNYECMTKVDIPLKASPGASAATALTVPAGTKVKLVSTDDREWIKIKAPGGTGWLQMKDSTNLVNPGLSAYDAFDGLNWAD